MTSAQREQLIAMDAKTVKDKYYDLFKRRKITMAQMGKVMEIWIAGQKREKPVSEVYTPIMKDDPAETIIANFGGSVVEKPRIQNPFEG